MLSTNGGKRYPFTFFGIEFGIGSFSWHPDRLEKRSNKRILVMLDEIVEMKNNIITFTKTIVYYDIDGPFVGIVFYTKVR